MARLAAGPRLAALQGQQHSQPVLGVCRRYKLLSRCWPGSRAGGALSCWRTPRPVPGTNKPAVRQHDMDAELAHARLISRHRVFVLGDSKCALQTFEPCAYAEGPRLTSPCKYKCCVGRVPADHHAGITEDCVTALTFYALPSQRIGEPIGTDACPVKSFTAKAKGYGLQTHC